MLGGGASMVISSILTSMANWSTPTVLFCVLNLMIGTIFIASNFTSRNHQHHNSPSQLTRSPSLLERVKSMNISTFYTTPNIHDEYRLHDSETTEYNSVSQLTRPPSLLQRVKSIDLSFSSFHNTSSTESEQLGNSTSELTRAPSFLDRVKSFKLASSFNSRSGDANTIQIEHSDVEPRHDPIKDHKVTGVNSHYNKSVSEKCSMNPAKKSQNNLMKSSSEKRAVESDDDEENVDRRRPATMKASVRTSYESVDAKADDFIKRFKQQLKLQRIDSLQRFREMLNRGS